MYIWQLSKAAISRCPTKKMLENISKIWWETHMTEPVVYPISKVQICKFWFTSNFWIFPEHPWLLLLIYTAKSTVISPDFLVWRFCGKAQFPHSFGRFARSYVVTVPYCKISTPGNQVKIRNFSQCYLKSSFFPHWPMYHRSFK